MRRKTFGKVAGGSRAGFTLLELLTVMGIIVLLCAIVVPVLSSMEDKGIETKAANNLRQIGVALNGFAAENDNYYPTARGVLAYTANTTDPEKLPWQQQLDRYIGYDGDLTKVEGTRKLFELPSRGFKYQRWGMYAYFLGSHASWAEAEASGELPVGQEGFLPVLKSRVTRPELHILAGEQAVDRFADEDADRDDYNTNDPAFGGGRIGRNTQILFVDGHVKAYNEFDRNEMTVRYEGLNSEGKGISYYDPVERRD
jgi:prepilin-type N-terminal cleavage/methylation domain-containing protein/prepilin-type processing-associated H-X9-DG protein